MDHESTPISTRPDGGLPHLVTRIALAALDAHATRDVLALALREVCRHTTWPVGHAFIVGADGNLRSAELWHPESDARFTELRAVTQRSVFGPGDGLPGRVLSSGAPRWIADVTMDANFPRGQLARDLGVRAAFAFPVPTPDGIAAVLEFFSAEPAPPDEDFLELITLLGLQLGRVFERTRAAEEMREREARFRSVAENAAEAIVTLTADDTIVYANPATARMFGYTAEELGTLPFTALMPERFRARHRAGIQRFTASGERRVPWDGIELPGLHREGHEIPLEITFGAFEREEGTYFTGIMRDISARKRAEEERQELLERERAAREEAERRAREEAALRHAAAAVSEAFTAEETAQRIAESALTATRADAAFVKRLDPASGELVVVAACGELAPAVGRRFPFSGSLAERSMKRREPTLLPRLEDADRHLADLPESCGACSLTVVPLLNGPEPIGALLLVRGADRAGFHPDEATRASTFGNLASLAFRKIGLLEDSERRREELERVMESRSRLMRGFGHDVKNPMGAADGFLQLIEEGIMGEVPESLFEPIGRARRSLGAAVRLIDDLLDIARAEAGQLEIRLAPTDLRKVARDTVEEFRGRARQKELELDVRLPEDFPLIESDPARVRQVVGNLLGNAVKYTPAGGRVCVRVDAAGEDVAGGPACRLAVIDNGPGVPADKHALLFEEFSRLDPTAGDGLGIGLAISRRIARALGGDIELESAPGEGSTFTLRLPLVGAPEPG